MKDSPRKLGNPDTSLPLAQQDASRQRGVALRALKDERSKADYKLRLSFVSVRPTHLDSRRPG